MGAGQVTSAHTLDLELLAMLARELGPDEVRVLRVLAERLLKGQTVYGRLDIANDRRSWKTEARDEAIDLAVYMAVDLVKTAP
jgi:hypothetical protein